MQNLMTIACILSTGIWIAVGLYKLTHRQKFVDLIRSFNIPLPRVSYWLSVFVELGGACLMLFQQKIWVAALAWLVFLCVTTPIFHGKIVRGGTVDSEHLFTVAKNCSIAGGLLALLIIDGTVPRFFGWS